MNNNNYNYWEKRINRIVAEANKMQNNKNKQLLLKYKNLLKQLKQEIYELYANINNISYAEAIKFNRLNNLKKKIEYLFIELAKYEEDFCKNNLYDTYKYVSKELIELFNNNFSKLNNNFYTINKYTINKAISYPWSGADYSDRIWRNKEKLVNNCKDIITRGLIQGTDCRKVSKQLQKAMNCGAYVADRLARTEMQHIVNVATIDRYKESGLVEKVKWLNHSANACSECQLLNGQVFKLNEVPMLPQHPNCTCCIAPYFDV